MPIVDHFVYLGSVLTRYCRDAADIESCISPPVTYLVP